MTLTHKSKNIGNPFYKLFTFVSGFFLEKLKSRFGLIFLGISILIFISFSLFFWNFVQDDTYIFLRYARNFSDGKGLVFNPGEYVEGCTNFLWTLIATIPFLVGLPPLDTLKLLSMFFGVLSLLMLYNISKSYIKNNFLFVVPVLLYAVNPTFVLWSQGGMGSTLFLFLILAHFSSLLKFWDTEKQAYIISSSIFLGIAAFTRPETPLFFVISAFVILILNYKKKSYKDFLLFTGIFLIFFLLFQIGRISYYGELFPNTFYAKVSVGMSQLKHGLHLYKKLFFSNLNFIFIIAACFLLTEKVFSPASLVLFLSFFLYTLYYIRIGTDLLPHHRLYIQIFPLFYLIAFHTFERLIYWLKSLSGKNHLFKIATALVIVFAIFSIGYSIKSSLNLEAFQNVRNSLESAHGAIGRYMQANHKKGDKVVVTDVGVTPYYAKDLYVIDLLGLTDKTVSKAFYKNKYNPWLSHLEWGKKSFEISRKRVFQLITDYFIKNKPRYVVVNISIPMQEELSSKMKLYGLKLPRELDEFIKQYIVFSKYHSIFDNPEISKQYKVIRIISYNDYYFLALLELKN